MGQGGVGDVLGQLGGMLGGKPGAASAPQPDAQPAGGMGGIEDMLRKLGLDPANMGQAAERQAAPGAGPASTPGSMGGFGDILGQLQKQLGQAGQPGPTGAGAAPGAPGMPGGSLMDILGQVLGQATSGVKEGAQRIDGATGASGHVADALGKMTGQSPDQILAKLKELIAANPMLAGAGLGGLGALVLGTRTGRSVATSAAKLGALALIGGLAYKAYQNYSQGRPVLGQQALTHEAAPQGTGFEEQAVTEDAAITYVRAMIAAAAADGRIDQDEQQRLLGGLKSMGLEREAEAFLNREISAPATVEDLAASVKSPQEAVQVYTAARIAIEPDSPAEARFLARLAAALGIDEGLARHIDAAARAA
jgi:uncharacterized membrane protein YebE (DUF533 family)